MGGRGVYRIHRRGIGASSGSLFALQVQEIIMTALFTLFGEKEDKKLLFGRGFLTTREKPGNRGRFIRPME